MWNEVFIGGKWLPIDSTSSGTLLDPFRVRFFSSSLESREIIKTTALFTLTQNLDITLLSTTPSVHKGETGGHDESPKGNDESPKGHDESPKGHDESPKGHDESPKGNDESPKGHDESPNESPKGNDESPKGHDESPKGNDKSPKGNDESPKGNDEVLAPGIRLRKDEDSNKFRVMISLKSKKFLAKKSD
jgi:hypothetical protein